MDFVVAIPSYRRAEKLRDQTLKFLTRENFPIEKIFVFVADEEEKSSYLEVLTPGTFGTLVVGVPGLSQQRNFILEFFPQGQKILCIDDDIKKLKFITPRPALQFVQEMFSLCLQEKLNLWGVYPVNNLFFCKERVTTGKLFCVHCFCGLINTKDFTYPLVACVDDKWLSLYRYSKDGAVLRYDGACPDTVYNGKGGLSEHRALFRTQEVRDVVKTFPDLCAIKKRKNGLEEIHWRPIVTKTLSLSPVDADGSLHSS